MVTNMAVTSTGSTLFYAGFIQTCMNHCNKLDFDFSASINRLSHKAPVTSVNLTSVPDWLAADGAQLLLITGDEL